MIDKSLNKIHELIEEPRLKYQLTRNNINWNQLCSSLDVLRDSQRALVYYKKSNFPEDRGGQYFYICGLLQNIFLQQNAAQHMCLSFNINIDLKEDYPILHYIKEIRNDTIGHPTNRQIKKIKSFHYVHNYSKKSFSYQTVYQDGRLVDKTVDITDVLSNQEKFINEIINNSANELKDRMIKHKKQFRDTKIVALLGGDFIEHTARRTISSLSVDQTTYDITHAKIQLQLIEKNVNKVKNEIQKRYGSLKALPSIYYIMKDLDYLLVRMKSFTGEKITKSRDGEYLMEAIHSRIIKIIEICKEIDDEYNKD